LDHQADPYADQAASWVYIHIIIEGKRASLKMADTGSKSKRGIYTT
jgi:hypothetical protein